MTRREERRWRRGDRQQAGKRLGRGEPELSFSALALLFGNCMAVAGWADYDVADLDAFVAYAQTHPVPPAGPDAPAAPPFDARGYAAGFAAWRQGAL